MSYEPYLISFNNKVVTQSNSALGWSSYVPDVYNLYLNQTVGGIINADKFTGYSGDIVTLSNTAASNYYFDSYSITGSTLTGNQFAFNNSDVTAEANFLSEIISTGTFNDGYTAGKIYYPPYLGSGQITNTRGISKQITLGGEGRLMVYRHRTISNPDYYNVCVINEAALTKEAGWASGKYKGLKYVSSIMQSFDIYSALVSANPTYYTAGPVIDWSPIRFCDAIDHYKWDGYWELHSIK